MSLNEEYLIKGDIPTLKRSKRYITPTKVELMEKRANMRNDENVNYSTDFSQPSTIKNSPVRINQDYFFNDSLLPGLDSVTVNLPGDDLKKICNLMNIERSADGLQQLSMKIEELIEDNAELNGLKIEREIILNDLRGSQLKNNELNANLTDCSQKNDQLYRELENFSKQTEKLEREQKAKDEERNARIVNLENEVFLLKEKESTLIEEIDANKINEKELVKEYDEQVKNLKQLTEQYDLIVKEKDEIETRLNSEKEIVSKELDSLRNSQRSLEKKNYNLKKSIYEKESKIEHLSFQLSTVKNKYIKKLQFVERESSIKIDSQIVEISLLKSINKKLNDGEILINNDQTSAQSSQIDLDTNILYKFSTIKNNNKNYSDYLRLIFENRYANALKDNKDLLNSNNIFKATMLTILQFNLATFEKYSKNEKTRLFKFYVDEFETRELLNEDDMDLLRKIIESNKELLKELGTQ